MYNITTYLLEWPKLEKILTIPNVGKDMVQLELSDVATGDAKWHSHFGKSLAVSPEVKHIPAI